MNLINYIPIGKKYRKTKEQLMYESKILNEKIFKDEITELRNHYVIMFDDGYYLPSSKAEYEEVIKELQDKKEKIEQKLDMMFKEMEERNEKI